MRRLLYACCVLGLLVLGAAMCTPHLVSRQASNQVLAASALQSGVYPAQVQFQRAALLDQDGDGTGEYGFLSELAGRRLVQGKRVTYLSGPVTQGDTCYQYRFAVWLPDGGGGALGEPEGTGPRPNRITAAPAQARRFRAYAWPDGTDGSKRMFCIDQDARVRTAPWTGTAPGWDAVTGGTGWEGEPTWPVWR